MLLIFDCNYVGWTVAHVFSKGLSYEGGPTAVIYGFMRQLLLISQKFEPNQIAFCWDNKDGKSLRESIYPSYKANRQELTEEQKKSRVPIFSQFNLLKDEIIKNLGFYNIFSIKGYESDDIIANLVAKRAPEETIVITGDEDLYQLLNNCIIYIIKGNRTYNKKDLASEHSLTPEEWVSVKALAGCNSDNVKGIEGVGVKTVEKYLHKKLKEKSKAFIKIETEKEEILKQNLPLVKLPFKNTPNPKLRPNNLTLDRYIAVCEKYGMESLLEDKYERIWLKMVRDME